MEYYEQGSNPETLSQQFIAYVTSHAGAPMEKSGGDVLCEGYWNVNVKLPLVADCIEQVCFDERTLQDSNGRPTGEHVYDIEVWMRSGLIGYFTHKPANSEVQFTFSWGETPYEHDMQEEDIAGLLAQLKEYEASGQMAKAKGRNTAW